MAKGTKVKQALAAVTKALEKEFPGISLVPHASAPASGSDVELYIRPPAGCNPTTVFRSATTTASLYADEFGVWILPVLEPQAKPERKYEIRVKSDRMRPTRHHPKGGWLPKAEVWVYGGDSVTVTPVEPKEIHLRPTREDADEKAREIARKWIAAKYGSDPTLT